MYIIIMFANDYNDEHTIMNYRECKMLGNDATEVTALMETRQQVLC